MQDQACQREDERACSRLSRPRAFVMATFLIDQLKHTGVTATSRKLARFVRARVQRFTPNRKGRVRLPQLPDECLGLEPGELVEVKSLEEILATLDESGKFKGLYLIPEMLAFCGERFTVHKRVDRIFLEESKQVRTMRNTVLLRDVMCDGGNVGCGKSCFYYWREIWLRRGAGS